MGIETLPDVEESTEPPICGFTKSIPTPHATASLSFEPCNPNEKPTPAPSHRLSPTNDQGAWHDPLDKPSGPTENAHLVEPLGIAALLQTDLQYVEINYPRIDRIQESSSHQVCPLEMEFPTPKRDFVSRGMDQTWFAKSRASPSGGYC